jgi:hypothetical protein
MAPEVARATGKVYAPTMRSRLLLVLALLLACVAVGRVSASVPGGAPASAPLLEARARAAANAYAGIEAEHEVGGARAIANAADAAAVAWYRADAELAP